MSGRGGPDMARVDRCVTQKGIGVYYTRKSGRLRVNEVAPQVAPKWHQKKPNFDPWCHFAPVSPLFLNVMYCFRLSVVGVFTTTTYMGTFLVPLR